MIDIRYVANLLETQLNNFGANYGKYFKVFADEGMLKKAVKPYGQAPIDFTSSILEVTSSQMTPIADIKLETYSFQLTMFVDLQQGGKNADGQSNNLIEIKELLKNFTDTHNGAVNMVSIGGKEFTQTITLDYPTNGQKTDLGFINDCLPLYWTINMAFFENGVNASNTKIIINGVDLPFTRATFTRRRTADNNTKNGSTETASTIYAQSFSLDLVMPALANNEFSALVMNDILNGGNSKLNVKIETPLATTEFIGTFGDNIASLDIATNIGYNISIVKADENTLD